MIHPLPCHAPATRLFAVGLCLATVAGCPSPARRAPEAFDELVAAERAFAAFSREHGMRDAFLEYLGPGSIVFRPGPVDGRQVYESRPPATGTLDWYPSRAEVSAAGDLGYTTGPWEFSAEGSESAFGHYASVWRRQADGTWRVALDVGIAHPRPPEWSPDRAPRDSRHADPVPARGAAAGIEERLRERDRELMSRRQQRGAGGAAEAYRSFGADDLTIYRNDGLPQAGEEAFALLDRDDAEVLEAAEPAGAGAAASGDLGYTYGTFSVRIGEAVQTRSYARFWRVDGAGEPRLVIDVELPVPAAT